jgi:DNA-binding SARP family transcriptional activator
VNVLGTLEVEDVDGRSILVRGMKQRGLLTLLAVNVGHVVSVDRLVDELWSEGLLGDVGNALQHHVSRLRKAIGASSRRRVVDRQAEESCQA